MMRRTLALNLGSFRRRSTASLSACLTVSLRLVPSARARASVSAARSSSSRTVRFFAMTSWYHDTIGRYAARSVPLSARLGVRPDDPVDRQREDAGLRGDRERLRLGWKGRFEPDLAPNRSV